MVEGARLERVCRATYREFESLPVCHSATNPQYSRVLGTNKSNKQATNTLSAKNSYGLRLLTVNDIYYYRRTIKGKDCKISLRTRDIKLALMRRNILNLMDDEAFMFAFEKGDYKFVFEYETMEEFREGVRLAQETYKQLHEHIDSDAIAKNEALMNEIRQASFMGTPTHKSHIESISFEEYQRGITFEDLEIRFVASKQKSEKVGDSTFKAYATAFDKLKRYFKARPIKTLDIFDFEEHRDYLRGQIKPKTINNHMVYVSMFMDFAEKYGWVDKNHAKGIETLKVITETKENFTDSEIWQVLRGDIPDEYRGIFEIAIFSGMRIAEIISLKPENILEDDDGIYYFNVVDSKTSAGIRKVPIHRFLEERGYRNRSKYPLLGNKTINAGNQTALRILYRILEDAQQNNKSFHTFRGTAINRMANNFPEKVYVIQEIVGHSKGDKSLTIDTYGKGFDLSMKKRVIDSIRYER